MRLAGSVKGLLTPYEDDSVDRLGEDHLLGVHAHEIAEVHARRGGEGLVQADGREVYREAAREMHSSLDGFDELGYVGVARVEAGVGVDNSNDGAGERILAVSKGFDENLAEEEGEVGIAVGGQALTQADGVFGV